MHLGMQCNGINIRHSSDGSLFNLRFQANTKVKTDIVNEFLFADDSALNATTETNMKNSVDNFSMASDNFGLTVSTKKKRQKWYTRQRLEKDTSSPPYQEWTTAEGSRKVHLPRQHPP